MKSLQEILNEGVFDTYGDGELEKSIEKDSTKMFLDNCKGDFKTVFFKDGSVRVNGKLIISGVESDKLYFNCREFKGNLIIENCPGLTTLEGSFLEKTVVFKGNITINQCPSLVTLKGISGLIDGNVVITNNKKLKSLEGLESVLGNLYWSGNGKKYTPEQISEKVRGIKKVFCSVENIEADVNESIINEAFNNPWLQKLARQLKQYKWRKNSWDDNSPFEQLTVDELFRKQGRYSNFRGRTLDKMTSDDVEVYNMDNGDDKKRLEKELYYAYSKEDVNAADLTLIFNEDIGEFVEGYGIATKLGVSCFNIPNKNHPTMGRDSKVSKSEAKNDILSYGIGYTVVVFKNAGDDKRYVLQNERERSRQGVINPGDVEQYKKIAQENIKRYKDELAKIRATRKSENSEYEKLIDFYEQINNRIVKLVRAIAKNPKGFDRYSVSAFLEWVRDSKRANPRYTYNGKNGPQYYGDYGLAYRFKEFIDSYMGCFGTRSSIWGNPNENDYKKLDAYAKGFKDACEKADGKLKELGF